MKKVSSFHFVLFLMLFLILISTIFIEQDHVFGQGFHERREKRIQESSQPRNVAGGEVFQIDMSFDKTYDTLLNFLKKQNQTIESASRDVGQIITAMTITGRWRQTGTRIQITLMKDNETKTTIRVAVTEQYRYKALTVEPWGEPKVNSVQSSKLTEEIKNYLKSLEITVEKQEIQEAKSPMGEFKLKDGSIIKGELNDPAIKVKTTLGEIEIKSNDIVLITGDSIKLKDGSIIKGEIITEVLKAKTSLGEISLGIKELESYKAGN